MLVEKFKRFINSDLKAFIDEREIEPLDLAARLADDYSLNHKRSVFLGNHLTLNQREFLKTIHRTSPYPDFAFFRHLYISSVSLTFGNMPM